MDKQTNKRKEYVTNMIILSILRISICLNIFMISNYQTTCENIDSRWKANVLYKMGHRSLDGDGDGIACENLQSNE